MLSQTFTQYQGTPPFQPDITDIEKKELQLVMLQSIRGLWNRSLYGQHFIDVQHKGIFHSLIEENAQVLIRSKPPEQLIRQKTWSNRTLERRLNELASLDPKVNFWMECGSPLVRGVGAGYYRPNESAYEDVRKWLEAHK
jgi:hypothetical protein